LWVADTDFCAPDFIVDALQQRLNHGVFGYGKIAVNLGAAIKKHLAQRYQWDIDSNQIVYLPGLVSALHLCVRCFSEEGDTIVVPSPVYYHLNKAPALAKRNLVNVDMILDEDLRWIPDFQALEQACAQTRCKMLLLCNPHNPGGTVYSREELEKVSHIAEKYNILIVSDEIHCDLILDKHSYHTPFASLNNRANA
jgi:cysteine-S-conjugate beta-lyase